MNGVATCQDEHTWRVKRESQRNFVLTRSDLPARHQRVAERKFIPERCPTCGKPALRVKESKL